MLTSKKNELFFDNVKISRIGKKYETPFFIMSEKAIKNNYENFKKWFSTNYKKTKIYYAIKSNNEISILKILNKKGSNAIVGCGHDLFLSLKSGFENNKIIFDSPYKSKEEIEYGIKENIHMFNTESLEELKMINKTGKKFNKKIKIGFRINLDLKGILKDPVKLYSSKFGIKIKEVIKYYKNAQKMKYVEPCGIHTHIGSQIIEIKPYLDTVDKLTNLAKTLEKENIIINEINIGGGYPSPTLQKSTIPSIILSQIGIKTKNKVPLLKEYGEKISMKFKEKTEELENKPFLCFEPGRSIVSSAGIMVSKVRLIKNGWVFLDASKNFLPESLFFAKREIIPTSKINQEKHKKYNFSGITLNTGDILDTNKKFPELKIGDVIALLDSGAYTISRANSFTTLKPPVYLIKNNTIKKIRRKETYEDIIKQMVPK